MDFITERVGDGTVRASLTINSNTSSRRFSISSATPASLDYMANAMVVEVSPKAGLKLVGEVRRMLGDAMQRLGEVTLRGIW